MRNRTWFKCMFIPKAYMIKYCKNIWKLPQHISKLLKIIKVNIFECAVLNFYIMELKRISILWLCCFVWINFQIPCILIEDTTATTAPPAKAPPWHHQTPTTDKVALMTSSIFFIEQVHRVFLGLVLDSNWLLDYVIGLWLGCIRF